MDTTFRNTPTPAVGLNQTMGTAQRSITCAVVHNHPIHYKHLLFQALANLNLDFEVLFTGAFSGGRLEAPLPEAGQYRYRIGFNGPYESAPPKVSAAFVWRSLNRLQPRAVVISGYYDVAAWTAWAWTTLRGARLILWAESNEFDYPRHFGKELLKRLFISRCDLAHVYGASNAAYIEKLGMKAERIYIKRAVCDTKRFTQNKQLDKSTNTTRELLYVGRFAPEKNLSFLLQAMAEVRQDRNNPKLVLSLVGYGSTENALRELTAQLGLNNVVRFQGKALQSELPGIYNRADVFILPSTREPWGLVANEAMLCGLPVLLSTQCGCAADLLTRETGWGFSPWQLSQLSVLLNLVATMPRERLRVMGESAVRLSQQYSPENCAAVVQQTVLAVTSAGWWHRRSRRVEMK